MPFNDHLPQPVAATGDSNENARDKHHRCGARPTISGYPRLSLSPKAEVSAPDSAKDFGRAKDEPMTGHQINSLVGDLVAMAQAMERVPMLESELNGAIADREDLTNTVQRLELKLIDAKNLEETLRSAIRDLEVARDDAELRFLELDEKVGKVLAMRADTADLVNTLFDKLTPPKPEPVVEPVLEQSNIPVISEVKPIAVDPTDAMEHTGSTPDASQAFVSTVADTHPSGQSETPPTPAQPSPTGTGTESVASDTEPTRYDNEGWVTTEWREWKASQPLPKGW